MNDTTIPNELLTWEPFDFRDAARGSAIASAERATFALGHDAPTLAEWLRARARLLRFAGITSAATAGLAARSALGVGAIAKSALLAHGWAERVVTQLDLELRIVGAAPPPGTLIVANHRSYVDIAAVLAAAPAIFLAKVEVGSWPVLGLGARIAHTIFVCREDPASRKQAIASMQRVLDQGTSVALFPEGTTTKRPGMLPFHPGSFRMAASRGYRVTPMALVYPHAEDAWVDDESFVSHFLRRCGQRCLRVSLHIGPTFQDDDPNRLKARAEEWILGRIGGHR